MSKIYQCVATGPASGEARYCNTRNRDDRSLESVGFLSMVRGTEADADGWVAVETSEGIKFLPLAASPAVTGQEGGECRVLRLLGDAPAPDDTGAAVIAEVSPTAAVGAPRAYRCVADGGGIAYRSSKDTADRYNGCRGPEHLEVIEAVDCGDGWLSVLVRRHGQKFVPIHVADELVFERIGGGDHPADVPAAAVEDWLLPPPPAVLAFLDPRSPRALDHSVEVAKTAATWLVNVATHGHVSAAVREAGRLLGAQELFAMGYLNRRDHGIFSRELAEPLRVHLRNLGARLRAEYVEGNLGKILGPLRLERSLGASMVEKERGDDLLSAHREEQVVAAVALREEDEARKQSPDGLDDKPHPEEGGGTACEAADATCFHGPGAIFPMHPLLSGRSLRQDVNGVVPCPETWDWSKDGEASERAYIHLLKLLALALDSEFKAHISAIVGPGGLIAAPPKSYARMVSKMISGDDHRYLAKPRPAHNVDVCRVLVGLDDAGSVHDVLHRISKASGGLARLKNGFALRDEEADSQFHLRVILANVVFESVAWPTFNDLLRDPKIQARWDEYHRTSAPDGEPGSRWRSDIARALSWLRGSEEGGVPVAEDARSCPGDAAVRFICEVQVTLASFVKVRHLMHEPYKYLRAPSGAHLYEDVKLANKKMSLLIHRFRMANTASTTLELACAEGDVKKVERILERHQVVGAEAAGGTTRPTLGEGTRRGGGGEDGEKLQEKVGGEEEEEEGKEGRE